MRSPEHDSSEDHGFYSNCHKKAQFPQIFIPVTVLGTGYTAVKKTNQTILALMGAPS